MRWGVDGSYLLLLLLLQTCCGLIFLFVLVGWIPWREECCYVL